MIGTSLDKQTVRACRLARAHSKRHLDNRDVKKGVKKGLAPGDPRKVFTEKMLPATSSTGSRMTAPLSTPLPKDARRG